MTVHPYGNMDAKEWAHEFMRINGKCLGTLTEDIMIGWFANAIMTGYDHDKGPINGSHAAYLMEQEGLNAKA